MTATEPEKGLTYHMINLYYSLQKNSDENSIKSKTKVSKYSKKSFFDLAKYLVSHEQSKNQVSRRVLDIYPNRDSPNKDINAIDTDLNLDTVLKPLPCVIEVYHCKFCEFRNDLREEMMNHYYNNHLRFLNEAEGEGSYLNRKIDLLITNGDKSFVNSFLC